jgi:hypothetical protein
MFTYRIQEGDSPGIIAKRFTGDPSRYKELLAANLWKIKVMRDGQPTFLTMRPGELLRVPPAWRTLPNAMAFPIGLGEGLGSVASTAGVQCLSDSDCTDPNNPSCNLVSQTCGPAATCNPPTATDDDSIIAAGTSCGAAFAQNAEAQLTTSQIWKNALAAAEKGIVTGTTDAIVIAGAITVVDTIATQLGFTFVTQIMNVIINLVVDVATGTAITAASLTASTATGAALGSELGPIGAVIGLVIGLIVGILGAFLQTCTVQITNGAVIQCTYYQSLCQYATTWINNQANPLGGIGPNKTDPNPSTGWIPGGIANITPKWFADKFSLFLANPNWLYANQTILGIPGALGAPPTDPNDPRTPIMNCPGAFEILNKAQLASASQLVTSSPGKIPFWAYIPVPGTPSVSQNPSDYQPLSANANNITQWAPGDYSMSSGSLPQITYTGSPNLMVGTANQAPQNQLSVGLYTLQITFPALTAAQCDAILGHAVTQNVYAQNIAAAKAWALGQCSDPTTGIGTGSQYNLEPQDVEPIVAEWKATVQPTCEANAAATAQTIGTAATVIAVAGAAAAGGVWWFAAQNRMTFGQSAKTLLRKGTGAVTKLIR